MSSQSTPFFPDDKLLQDDKSPVHAELNRLFNDFRSRGLVDFEAFVNCVGKETPFEHDFLNKDIRSLCPYDFEAIAK